MLTRSGLGAAVGAVVLTACGWWWHYEELVVMAAVVATTVVGAVWSARRPTALSVLRRVHAVRIPRGDPVRLTYRVANEARHRSSPVTITDAFACGVHRTPIWAVDPGRIADVARALPTERRGLFELGPGSIVRRDPFELAVGTSDVADRVPIVVHPRVHALNAATGSIRTTESESSVRRATVDPLSGFVSLREYVPGDDPRLIHWPTTAHKGTLMVREHVEVRRPEFTVVLDTSTIVGTADDFEEMVDVAASIAVHALRDGLDVVVRTTDRAHPGRRTPLRVDTHVLDLLTPVARTTGPELLSIAALFTGGFDQTSITLVTGPRGPSSGLAAAGRMTVARIGRGADIAPGVTIAAEDARRFVERWRAWH